MSAEDPAATSEDAAASFLGLPLRLEVVLDSESEKNHRFVLWGNRSEQAAAEYWLRQMPWYLGFVLGIYGCLQSNMIFLAAVIGVNWFYVWRTHWTASKTAQFGGMEEKPPQPVTILIDESGMAELDRGVEARFDWSAMRRWLLYRSTLFIELTNRHWAIIPAKSMKPAEFDLEKLASFLKIKGVNGKRVIVSSD